MSSPIVTSMQNAFRYLPQRTLEGALGQNIGHRVEGWMGMSPSPEEVPAAAPAVAMPDQNYHRQMVEQANESFRHQAEQPDLTQMRKPLKGK